MNERIIEGRGSLRGHEMMEFEALVINLLCTNRKIYIWTPDYAKHGLVLGRKSLVLKLES